jgi:ABC-2 type transport system ATP-binding protein
MIARALVHQPRLLILDEPTAGVDIEIRRSMWRFLREINAQGTTIILTTHYLEEAESLCRNIAIIDHGLIKTIDSPARLKRRIGAELVRIKFADDDDDKIAHALRCIGDLAVVERVERQDGQCTAVVKNGDAAIPAIFSATYPSGLKISSVALKKPSLDDVYMAFTGKELRNETGNREEAHRSHMMLRRMRA